MCDCFCGWVCFCWKWKWQNFYTYFVSSSGRQCQCWDNNSLCPIASFGVWCRLPLTQCSQADRQTDRQPDSQPVSRLYSRLFTQVLHACCPDCPGCPGGSGSRKPADAASPWFPLMSQHVVIVVVCLKCWLSGTLPGANIESEHRFRLCLHVCVSFCVCGDYLKLSKISGIMANRVSIVFSLPEIC